MTKKLEGFALFDAVHLIVGEGPRPISWTFAAQWTFVPTMLAWLEPKARHSIRVDTYSVASMCHVEFDHVSGNGAIIPESIARLVLRVKELEEKS